MNRDSLLGGFIADCYTGRDLSNIQRVSVGLIKQMTGA